MAHTIKFKVEGHSLSLVDEPLKLIHSNTDYSCQFELDSEWAARTSITAVFRRPSGNYVDVALDDNHKCKIPLIDIDRSITVGLYSDQSVGSTKNLISTKPYPLPIAESILSTRNAELEGSINKSTEEVLADCTKDLADLEKIYNNILSGKTAVIVDVTA